jgi:hypothetical protein
MNSGVSAVRPSLTVSLTLLLTLVCVSDFTTAFATVPVLAYTSYKC